MVKGAERWGDLEDRRTSRRGSRISAEFGLGLRV